MHPNVILSPGHIAELSLNESFKDSVLGIFKDTLCCVLVN
jgi:hypothetical protein